MLAMVAAADSTSTVRKKYSVFIDSEAEPHAMYAIYKQTRTLCVLQYLNVFHCGKLALQYTRRSVGDLFPLQPPRVAVVLTK